MEIVLLSAIAVGVWVCVGVQLASWRWWARQAEDAHAELTPDTRLSGANGHPVEPQPLSWSPEGWGRDDTEVRLSDADEFLGRLRRPPTDDE
jgi:hypothetical protein